jgi:hypothetical protein
MNSLTAGIGNECKIERLSSLVRVSDRDYAFSIEIFNRLPTASAALTSVANVVDGFSGFNRRVGHAWSSCASPMRSL